MTDTLALDPRTTALILIDLQHGTLSLPLVPYASADVAARGAQLADAFRRKGATVAYVHVDLAHAVRPVTDTPVDLSAQSLPVNASEFVPEAGLQAGDIVLLKKFWGAFTRTNLGQQLSDRDIKTIVLLGVATNLGVESTAREAVALGYELVAVEDAMSSFSAELHNFSVNSIFPMLGRVRTTNQVLESFR